MSIHIVGGLLKSLDTLLLVWHVGGLWCVCVVEKCIILCRLQNRSFSFLYMFYETVPSCYGNKPLRQIHLHVHSEHTDL